MTSSQFDDKNVATYTFLEYKKTFLGVFFRESITISDFSIKNK